MDALIDLLPAQSVLIGVGLLVGATTALLVARRMRVDLGEALAAFGLCVVAGAALGRLAWALLDPAAHLGALAAHPALLLDPRSGGYSSFGALGGGALVVAWWQSRWGPGQRDRAATDRLVCALVLGGLAGLAVARLGCLAHGCDFGWPSTLPWAVRHPAGTDAYAVHLLRGWISPESARSAPVHPFGLYLSVGTAIIVAAASMAVWRGRVAPRLVATGAAGAYLALRFGVEWVRDPSTALMLGGWFNVNHLLALLGLCGVALSARRARDLQHARR